MQDHGLDDTTAITGEERRQTSVPLPLERFSDAARMIDGHAHLYLWVIVASYITGVMDAIEKVVYFISFFHVFSNSFHSF